MQQVDHSCRTQLLRQLPQLMAACRLQLMRKLARSCYLTLPFRTALEVRFFPLYSVCHSLFGPCLAHCSVSGLLGAFFLWSLSTLLVGQASNSTWQPQHQYMSMCFSSIALVHDADTIAISHFQHAPAGQSQSAASKYAYACCKLPTALSSCRCTAC